MYRGEERIIQIPGFSIAAREWGDKSGLPILALHGWLDNASSFEFLAPLLEEAHVVAIDLPGCGHSSHRAEGTLPSILDEIFYVLQIADVLGWKDFVLLGHSKGGALAQLVSAAGPERVRALILLDIIGFYTSTGDNAAERLRKVVENFFAFHPTATAFKDLDDAAKGRMLSSPIAYESALALAKRGTGEVDGVTIWTFDRRERNLSVAPRFSEEQLAQILEGIRARTLIVLADKGIFPDKNFAKQRASHISHHELHYVSGGHHVHMDNAPAVAKLLNPFLKAMRS